MDLGGWVEDLKRTLKVARKPGWEDLWTTFKITFLGFSVVGLVGFVIQLIAAVIPRG